MSFQTSTNFFNEHVALRCAQVLGARKGDLSLFGLEWQLSTMPYYDFSFHEKALFRPAYHLLHLVHDVLRLLENMALTVASLYFDRGATIGLLNLTFAHVFLMLSDVVLAAASVVTLITRSIASLCSGYLAKDLPEEPSAEAYFSVQGQSVTNFYGQALSRIAPVLTQEKALDKRTVNYEMEESTLRSYR